MRRVALLIDGGFLRVQIKSANKNFEPSYIEKVALACVEADEDVLRIFYYDAPPYHGNAKLPVSGKIHSFKSDDGWLKVLAKKDLFAIRLGVLKFRGFNPKNIPISSEPLTDDDFRPDFEQKGVDMRIGLDIALFCQTRAVDRIILVTNDTDCIPAMKYARRAGLQIALIELPGRASARELMPHTDFHRRMPNWP
jgi:uncharacterized LabA/DUF88 family protein